MIVNRNILQKKYLMTGTIKYILLCLILLGYSNIYAEVYKWVDKDGHTHYGEKPPGEGASTVDIDTHPDIDENVEKHNKERGKLLEIYEEERKMKEDKKQQAEKEEKELREKCAALENELKDMKQTGLVFYDLDENGERRYISEKELAARVDQMQKKYDKYCN